MTSVWPALWPPWKRTTTSARADSQSTSLPLPSSPHWAPTTVTLAMDAILHPAGWSPTALRQGLGGGSDRASSPRRGAFRTAKAWSSRRSPWKASARRRRFSRSHEDHGGSEAHQGPLPLRSGAFVLFASFVIFV